LPGLKVLVVDDSQAMRRSIVYALQKLSGVTCLEAADGAEAVKKLAQARYDAVICDINMPVMDGLKVISHMRQVDDLREVPIVVITTEGGASDRQRALALGANRYLVKPVQARVVIDTIRDLLHC
jgi:two-component system, chemotaxis family, chemotaxis protein CheY